jgi:maltodextrin utilization protein YvdJ
MAGAILATTCIVAVFYVLAAVLIGMTSPLLGRADLFLISTLETAIWLVVGALGVPFVLAVLVVAYQDLKLREQERTVVRP